MTETREPAVIVDNVNIIYRVYAGGKLATGAAARSGILSKGQKLREVHAVKDVSFTLYRGESLGIIGSNGSGKSSLLRAAAGLTPVESGAIYVRSRPTLLGVGSTLLPDLSGEKNIMLGGMGMGLDKAAAIESIRPITEFSGLSEFIDLPLRTYSSGMSARLRFAIAAYKDHDILIIDEALAVGDAQFRVKSEARMRELRESASNVILVSHSMESIRDTCTRVLWLEKGVLRMDGLPDEVINAYTDYQASLK